MSALDLDLYKCALCGCYTEKPPSQPSHFYENPLSGAACCDGDWRPIKLRIPLNFEADQSDIPSLKKEVFEKMGKAFIADPAKVRALRSLK